MSRQRLVETCFWDDGYIIHLDPSEKLLFLYLLTNPLTAICGVYEISLRRIAFDTGFEQETVKRMLDRFERDERCIYRDGWIAMRNWIKHQSGSPKVQKGIEVQLGGIPADLAEYVLGHPPSACARTKKRSAAISGAKRSAVLERDNHRCCFCGRTAQQGILEIDHIVPIAKGGTDDIDNLRVLCQECNGARNTTEYDMGVVSYINTNTNTNINDKADTEEPKSAPVTPLPKFSFSPEDGFAGVPHEDIARWRDAYPAVNIDLEMKRAAEWLRANPAKRKSNYRRFLTNWFSRTQDRGGTVGYRPPQPTKEYRPPQPEAPLTEEERAANLDMLKGLGKKLVKGVSHPSARTEAVGAGREA